MLAAPRQARCCCCRSAMSKDLQVQELQNMRIVCMQANVQILTQRKPPRTPPHTVSTLCATQHSVAESS